MNPNQIHNERRPPADKHRRFEDDGEEVEPENSWTHFDRYIAIALTCQGPLTPVGRQALDDWKRTWKRT